MDNFVLFFMLTVLLSDYCSGQLSSIETLKRTTFCSFDPLSLSCGDGTIIAIDSVRFAYDVGCESTCCMYNASHCIEDLDDTEYVLRECSGKQACSIKLSDTHAFCSLGLKGPSYVIIEHYCIPQERIVKVSSRTTISSNDGSPLYLTSNNYPSVTTGDSTSSSCSLEVFNCSSSIKVYTIDADLYYDTSTCEQSLQFVDGTNTTVKEIKCESYYGNTITVDTLNTHYLKIDFLDNSEQNQEGLFFLAFSATDARFSLTCSYLAESWCVDCGALPDSQYGSAELDNALSSEYGASASVTCDTGYETSTATINCLANATWGSFDCTRKDCGTLPSSQYGSAELDNALSSEYGASASVTCNTGYETSTATINCLADGTWENFDCTRKDCGTVPSISNGQVSLTDSTNTRYEATAIVTCETGYETSKPSITCQSTGLWETVSLCTEINDGGGNDEDGTRNTDKSKENDDDLAPGVVAAIVIACLVAIVILCAVLYVMCKKKTDVSPTVSESKLILDEKPPITQHEYVSEVNITSQPLPPITNQHETHHGPIYIDHGDAHIFKLTIHLPFGRKTLPPISRDGQN